MAGWGNIKTLQIHSSQMKEKLDRLVNKENQQHVQEVSSMQVGRLDFCLSLFCGEIIIPDICHERHEYIRVNFFGRCKFLQI